MQGAATITLSVPTTHFKSIVKFYLRVYSLINKRQVPQLTNHAILLITLWDLFYTLHTPQKDPRPIFLH